MKNLLFLSFLCLSLPLFGMELPKKQETRGIIKRKHPDVPEAQVTKKVRFADEVTAMEEDEAIIEPISMGTTPIVVSQDPEFLDPNNEQINHKSNAEVFGDLLPFEDPEIQDLLPSSSSTTVCPLSLDPLQVPFACEPLSPVLQPTIEYKMDACESLFPELQSMIECGLDTSEFINKEQLAQAISAKKASSAASGFGILPSELKRKIFDYLITARGITNDARLANAAANIRNFALVNKEVRKYIKNYKSNDKEVNVVEDLINGLAEQYAPGNPIKAATIFGTADAGKWLADYIRCEDLEKVKNNKEDQAIDLFENAYENNELNIINFLHTYLPHIEEKCEKEFPQRGIISHDPYFSILEFVRKVKTIIKVPGTTYEVRLSNAVENIHAVAQEDGNFAQCLNQPEYLKYLVVELANLYANGNPIKAAVILGVAHAEMENICKLISKLYLEIPDGNLANFVEIIDYFNEAIKQNNSNITQFLIKYTPFMSKPEFWDDNYQADFPLFLAAEYGSTIIIDQLLNMAPIRDSVNYRDSVNFKRTALMGAATNGNLEIVKKLRAAGADIELRDWNGSTALHIAILNNHTEIVQQLIDDKANIDAADKEGNTALMLAAKEGNIEIVEQLLTAKAHINMQDRIGWTALICAAQRGYPKIVQRLLQAGANPDIQTNIGITALWIATAWGHTEVMEQLLVGGANIYLANHKGETALDYALRLDDSPTKEAIIKLLRDADKK